MKRTSIALLVLAAAGVLSLTAGAAPNRTTLTADLRLRIGVGQAGHPAVVPQGLYGAFDGTYNAHTGTLGYSLRYKGLRGPAFRVVLRSRATGATFAVLCRPCNPVPTARPGHDEPPVSRISGSIPIDPDIGFLITHGRAFVQADTTAYPSGEIAGPVFRKEPEPPSTGPGPIKVRGTPRCC
jgi:hypothetical protein